ncbi:MAG: type II toxin-antitoxin system Phd/YefM family antitoxin [Spirochaetia bacterium]
MSSVNVTNARKDLYKLVQRVNSTHEPVEITGKDSNAVLVGEEDWRSIQETLYLTSIPGMRESIIEGMNTSVDDLSDDLDW